jgi:hypothetical protein
MTSEKVSKIKKERNKDRRPNDIQKERERTERLEKERDKQK